MTETPETLAQRLRFMSSRGYWPLLGDEAAAALEAQAAQIEALRADAEQGRRLLRSIASTMRLVQLRPSLSVDWSEMLKTIDAAMAAKEPK